MHGAWNHIRSALAQHVFIMDAYARFGSGYRHVYAFWLEMDGTDPWVTSTWPCADSTMHVGISCWNLPRRGTGGQRGTPFGFVLAHAGGSWRPWYFQQVIISLVWRGGRMIHQVKLHIILSTPQVVCRQMRWSCCHRAPRPVTCSLSLP